MKDSVINRLIGRLKQIQRFERAATGALLAGYWLYEFIRWLLQGWWWR
jgi:hypothetical protein